MFETAEGSDWVRVLATSGVAEELIWDKSPRFRVGLDPFLLEIKQARKPVVSVDMRTDPRTDKAMVERVGLRTGIHVPLLLGGNVIGALGIATFGDEGVIEPTEMELEHLSVFALLVAAAFDRVRLLDEKSVADIEAARRRTKQILLEAELRQAQKMEVVGTLAGGIAHDFNNLLMAILGHGQWVREGMAPTDRRRESMDAVLAAARRATHLTRNLLLFSRKHVIALQPLSVQQVLHSLGVLLRPMLREDVALRVEVPDEALIVRADPGALEQVLLNLVNNARDAMPNGGALTIRASAETIDDAFIAVHGGSLMGRCAQLTVTDTGAGMSAETLRRVFEPFFTTKEVGKGTGLGLSTSHGIIEQFGGHIAVESEVGRGTTFRVLLPLCDEAIAADVAQTAIETAPGKGVVLLAEDDEPLRRFIAGLLTRSGYRVIEAADGQEAIDEFRAHSDEIQLVLTDVVLPKRSGRDVFEAVRAFQQDTRVLFTTGYPTDVLGPLHGPVLAKPVSPSELLTAVRRALSCPEPNR